MVRLWRIWFLMCQQHLIISSLIHRLPGLVFWEIQRRRLISQTGLRHCDDPSRYSYFRVVGIRPERAFCKSRCSHQIRPRFAFYIGGDGLEDCLALQKRTSASCIAATGVRRAGDPASWRAGVVSHSRSFNGKRLAPDIHNDPFDRILVAEALQHRCRLVTKDATIPLYPGVVTIW